MVNIGDFDEITFLVQLPQEVALVLKRYRRFEYAGMQLRGEIPGGYQRYTRVLLTAAVLLRLGGRPVQWQEILFIFSVQGVPATRRQDITPENAGIYHARLLKYESRDGTVPPSSVVLVRGIRHWAGSTDDQFLVDELGQAIERRVRGGDPHSV